MQYGKSQDFDLDAEIQSGDNQASQKPSSLLCLSGIYAV